MKTECTVAAVAARLGAAVEELLPGAADTRVARGAPADQAQAGEVTFVRYSASQNSDVLHRTRASLVLVEGGVEVPKDVMRKNGVAAVIHVPNARLAFLRVLNSFFVPKHPSGLRHPTAVLHPEADIHPEASIGPFCEVGRCRIGAGAVLRSRVTIYDGVSVGENTWIDSGAVIGADGFGFERAEDGSLEKFPHTGGVVIGTDVEVGANVCIDRGTMQDTVIGDGTRIDNLVHLSHNVRIGRHCLIIAGTILCGRVTVGDRCWIGPGTVVRQGVVIGADAHVSIGCLVTQNVDPGVTVLSKGLGFLVDKLTPQRNPSASQD